MQRRRLMAGGSFAAVLAGVARAQPSSTTTPAGLQPILPGPVSLGGAPSLDLNFTNGLGLDSRITFTRASAASYFDVAGALQSAASGVARFDFDPVTHAARGLLIEEARTNLLLNSATLSTQSVTTTATAYTLSFYGTGTVTLTGTSTAGPLVGSGAFPARVTQTFTPTAGTLTLTVSGSVLNAQIEAGAFATSWISTAGASAARVTELASLATSPWFTAASAFSVAGEFSLLTTSQTNLARLMSFSDGTTSNLYEWFDSSGFLAFNQAVSGASNSINIGAIVLTPKLALAGRAGTQSNVLNAAAAVASSFTGIPTLTQLTLGNRVDGVRPMSGYLRRLRYWPRTLTNTELQQVTV